MRTKAKRRGYKVVISKGKKYVYYNKYDRQAQLDEFNKKAFVYRYTALYYTDIEDTYYCPLLKAFLHKDNYKKNIDAFYEGIGRCVEYYEKKRLHIL